MSTSMALSPVRSESVTTNGEQQKYPVGYTSKEASEVSGWESPSRHGSAPEAQVTDPLRAINADSVNYKSMSWWHCALLMIAEVISLGILSLPYAVAQLGLVPGIISILGLGVLATYSGYVIGQFKARYPNVLCMADAGLILFGPFGYHLFCWAALLSFIFIMAAHILTFSVAMNVLTNHATCSIAWAVLGTALSIVITLPRTLKNISYYSLFSCLSILVAVFIVMVSVGVSGHGHGHSGAAFRDSYTFQPSILAILNITIAYMGNVAFFGFIAELRKPRDFTKALFFLQGVTVLLYLIVGVVIYCYVGPSVVSPALGSTNSTIKKVSYGIALGTIIVAGVVNAHVACKQMYVQLWRKFDPSIVTSRSLKAKGSWVAIVIGSWLLAFVLALAIPIFNEMLGFISALFGSWFTYGVCGMFWFKLNWDWIRGRSPSAGRRDLRKWALLVLNIFMIVLAALMCGLGLYVSGKGVSESTIGHPFSCADTAP